MKTAEEIQKEIETLNEMKPKVRAKSTFGDNHHNAIDAQMTVLGERLSTDQIYDRWEPGDDDDLNEDEGRAQNVLDEALYARQWLEEEEPVAPSENWESLVQ